MNFAEVVRSVGLPEADAAPLRSGWEESMASFPDETPGFLRPEAFAESRKLAGLPAEADAALRAAAERIGSDPALARLAWHLRRLLFDDPSYSGSEVRRWPEMEDQLGPLAGALYLLVLLDAVPRARRKHRQRAIPDDVSLHTCSDIALLAKRYRTFYPGRWGAPVDTIQWPRNHAAGTLIRLGRLQYQPGPFGYGLDVFRHRRTGATVALSRAGCAYDENGYRVASDGDFAREPAWVSSRSEEDGFVEGNPVSPEGRALPGLAALDLGEWERVVGEGTTILQMHIPSGEGLSIENTGESMRRAAEFFPRHFPDMPFRAFVCSSWLFSTLLADILGDRSNIVRWQRQTYLFPTPAGGHSGLRFIFGKADADLSRAPRDTRIRRGVLDLIERGECFRGGGMFYLPEDLRDYGAEVYRRRWPEAIERLARR